MIAYPPSLAGTLLPAGPPGETGLTGPQGPAGPAGATGSAGPTGSSGPAPWSTPIPFSSGLTCQAVAPATAVTYGGSLYVCTTAHVTSAFDATKWVQIISSLVPSGILPTIETLTVTALNTLSTITHTWSGSFAILFVNGQAYFPPAFSLSVSTVTWSPGSAAGLNIDSSMQVVILYSR